jgi:hypothetical protein
MSRIAWIVALLMTLAACASAPAGVDRVASARTLMASDGLECMAGCLEDGVEDCESCANRCLERAEASGLVAWFRP